MSSYENICIFCSKGVSNLYINNTCTCEYVYHDKCWNKYVVDHSSHNGDIPQQIPCPVCKVMVTRVNTHLKNMKKDIFIDNSPIICCGCFGAIIASATSI